jgi:hypothetical protein
LPCRARERLTGDDPRRCSTMHGGGRLFELLGEGLRWQTRGRVNSPF